MTIQNNGRKKVLGFVSIGLLFLCQFASAEIDTKCNKYNKERDLLLERFYKKEQSNKIAIALIEGKIHNSNKYRKFTETQKGKKIYLSSLKNEKEMSAFIINALQPEAVYRAIIEKNIELIQSEIQCYQEEK